MAWKKTTEAKYWEMLEILPPACMAYGGFLVGEPWNHSPIGEPRFEAYVTVTSSSGGKEWWVNTEPMTIAEFRSLMRFGNLPGTLRRGVATGTPEISRASHTS